MPGKYSHSVVLADYSSRGLISLPNEQHIAYLKSSPYPASTYSRNTSRAPSQGSNTPHNKSRKTSSQQEYHDRPSTSISSNGRYLIIDPTTVHGQYDRTPSYTQSTTRLRSNSADPASVSRRGYNDTATKIVESGDRPNVIANSLSRANIDEARTGAAQPSQPIVLPPSWNTIQPTAGARKQSSEIVRSEPSDQLLLTTRAIISPNAPSSPVAPRTSSDSMRNGGRISEDPVRQLSSGSITTQMYRPLSPTFELDFEGFSDAEETNTSYFDRPAVLRGISASNAGAGTSSLSRKMETPPPRPVSQSRQSNARTLQSSLSAPSDRFLATSSDEQQGKLNSINSLSSLGSWGTPSTSRINKQIESNKVAILAHSSLERLPEIMEDNRFGPDLFAQALDDVKPSGRLAMEGFGESALGMISSGRDFVPNVDSDRQSLASTACPPDIGRFREDDVVDTKQYLQPIRSQERRSASTHVPMVQTKKSKSLFSRFKSRALS